jgi:rare lipoprotein A
MTDLAPSRWGLWGGATASLIALALLCAACSEEQRAADRTPAVVLQESGERAPSADHATLPFGEQLRPDPASSVEHEIGIASWYGRKHHGKRTASGNPFDMFAFTAAHRSLPFGTVVQVDNLANGRSVRVRITDRGPYLEDRIIDLSMAAAQRLGIKERGLALVKLSVVRSSLAAGQTFATATP